MTPKEFIFWLRGVNVGLSGHPYEGTWTLIQEKLSEVETDDKPYRITPEPILDPPSPTIPIKVPPSPGSPPEIIC
jgi:hypothetical protein|tara:strand:+ start:42 stop:266 length:225 start_codon:yes stop_codon:yes gene_type:complete